MGGSPAWQGGVAIARAADSTTQVATANYRYLVCDKGSISADPILAARTPGVVPDYDRIFAEGFKYGFSITGIEVSLNDLGYLLWLFQGHDTWDAGNSRHSVMSQNDRQYCNVAVDTVQDLAAGLPTRVLLGAKIESMDFEVEFQNLVKVTIAGQACNIATPAARLTPSIPIDTSHAPLDWTHFVAGYFKMAFAAGSLAANDDITKFKLAMKRPLIESGKSRARTYPSDLRDGIREYSFSFEQEAGNASLKDLYAGFIAQTHLQIGFKFMVDTLYIEMLSAYGHLTKFNIGEVCRGDDLVKLEIEARMKAYAGADILACLVKDGSTGAYV